MAAIVWMAVAVRLSIPCILDLRLITGQTIAIMIIAGLAYIPGYMTAFLLVSLLLDRQPS
ncbi:hypothetical protein [Effusibacillus dendaii]|uniref:hypothetical protein n=1 Tax=Effusibacillus dendaii TaxID=2743772 RepID=UPI001CF7DB65|nr:hypothetical protein [Effusibacillus dendaii]